MTLTVWQLFSILIFTDIVSGLIEGRLESLYFILFYFISYFFIFFGHQDLEYLKHTDDRTNRIKGKCKIKQLIAYELWCLAPLSTVFQLYRGRQFKTSAFSLVTFS